MRAWVLHPDLKSEAGRRAAAEGLAEAVSLARALPSIEVAGSEIVSLPRPQPGLLFGSGKVETLRAQFEAAEIGLVLVDGAVTPVQQRNLEKKWGLKLLDRTGLILEIFADRARTREGVLQVELAALSYQRTRLVRAWTHLERQRGGFGFVGGPGETQIEADRRAIDEGILRIKRQLGKVVKTRELHRAARRRIPHPVVALVGYTNAGKSTLFNRITGASVLAEDMLFATLDPTMRGVAMPSGRQVILSDTVGFISDLPTELVAAFRATLEEVLEADLVLHVRDIGHPETERQAADVTEILARLGVRADVPRIEVWNKLDLVPEPARASLTVQAARSDDVAAISALTGDGVAALLARVTDALDDARHPGRIALPFADGRRRAWLHEAGVIETETATEDGYALDLLWTDAQETTFRNLGGADDHERTGGADDPDGADGAA